MGGTEILSPLSFILQQEVKAGLARQVFVLTDGQVSNSSACIRLVKKHAMTNRVFTLGVGSAADRHLVKGLARAGQGTAMFTSQGEQITPKIMEQLKNALQPCIADIEVKWGKSGQFEGRGEMEVEVKTKKTLFGFGKPKSKIKFSIKNQVPSKVPPIYDGSRLIVYKKIEKNFVVNEEITIKAKTTEGVLEHTFKITTKSHIEGRNLHQLFARKFIQEIEERQETENNEEAKELITELGMKYNLASKYTSFVGVDEKIFSSHQNNLAMGMKTRQVPNQTPFGYRTVQPLCQSLSASPYQIHSANLSMNMFSLGAASGSQSPCQQSSHPARATFGAAPGQQNLGSWCASSDSDDGSAFCKLKLKLKPQALTSMPPSSEPSPCVKLTLAQNANGSFPVTEDVTRIMNLDLAKTLDHGKPLDPRAWVTLICIAYLKTFCQKDEVIWELVVTKAEKWLNSSFPAMGEESLQKAVAFLRVCPLGHPLRPVPEAMRGGQSWHCDMAASCVGGHAGDGIHSEVSVWRCDQDWRMGGQGQCDYDMCGDCAQKKT